MLAALPACSNRIAEAERRYELVKKARAPGEEICARGREVVEAYIEEGNAEQYRDAQVRTSIDCQAMGDRIGVQP